MKLELNISEENQSDKGDISNENTLQSATCDVAIDVGHILAANQALLKNMARKIENLEKKLISLEAAYNNQNNVLKLSRQNLMLLSAPPKKIKVWQEKSPKLNNDYFKRFSLFDKLFRPWVLRRNAND